MSHLHAGQLLLGDAKQSQAPAAGGLARAVQFDQSRGRVDDGLGRVFFTREDTGEHLQVLDAARQPLLTADVWPPREHGGDLKNKVLC